MVFITSRAQEALEDQVEARMEAEALAKQLRQQLIALQDAQSRQQRSSQRRLSALQAHLQSLAPSVVCVNAASSTGSQLLSKSIRRMQSDMPFLVLACL